MPYISPSHSVEVRELSMDDPLAEPTIHFLWKILEGKEPASADIQQAYNSGHVYAVAEPVDIIASAIVFETQRRRGKPQRETYVSYLATTPSARHRGYGRLLVATAAERGLAAGDAQITVDSSQGAVPFYRHLGFEVTEHYSTSDAVYMTMALNTETVAGLRTRSS